VVDKHEEVRIARLVYPDPSIELSPHEMPDMIATRKGRPAFGIEVTELFPSESAARATKIDNYVTEILDKRAYRHRKDRGILPIERVQIWRDDELVSEPEAIVQKLPSLSEYRAMLASRIEVKSMKAADYDRSTVAHSNLVVADKVGVLATLAAEDVYPLVFDGPVREVLRDTCFREVYLLTTLKEPGHACVPLRLLWLVAEYFLFAEAARAAKIGGTDLNARLAMFSSYLRREGASGVSGQLEDGRREVGFAGYGILLEGHGVVIRDYSDSQPPSDVGHLEVGSSEVVPRRLLAEARRIRKTHTFRGNLVRAIEKGQ
jgi:hypothetical protein